MIGAAALKDYRQLMAGARDPADVVTQAFGGVLARYRIRGLETPVLARLVRQYFPGVDDVWTDALCSGDQGGRCTGLCPEEFDDLLMLLREHRSDDSEETEWLARAVATACLGDNHLWQDMGLPNRNALSELLRRYFTTLYLMNTGNMKWKKFFYKKLCERAEVIVCKAPSCSMCSEYANCFSSEGGGAESLIPTTPEPSI
jgi:nitrogen fixation protein NifQ